VSELAKSNQERHSKMHTTGSVLFLVEPVDVTLDRIAEPRGADSVGSSRANEMLV
jgi:hypothetical protein